MISPYGTTSTTFRLLTRPYSLCEPVSYYRRQMLIFRRTHAPFDGQACRIANPHSNAVADFDGDCLAGLHISINECIPDLTALQMSF